MKLTNEQIAARISDIGGWTFQDNALRRQFTFESFPDAVAFVARLAFSAEAADHHPDVAISYRKVTLTWSTHSDGGVTEKDFAGAKQSDTIAKLFPQRVATP